jgi:hypothetical protein
MMTHARHGFCLLFSGSTLLIEALGCGFSYGEPGPSWRAFDETLGNLSPPQAVVVLIVDDRPSASAVEMRGKIGAAMRQLGSDAVRTAVGPAPDWAAWHPIDVAVVIVPASAGSLDAAISPARDARLAWTTKRATPKTAEDVALAVEEHVRGLVGREGAAFQPLARARAIVDLLTRARRPASNVEEAIFAAVSSRARWIGVSIVATEDDESPGPTMSYRLPKHVASIGLATSRRDAQGEVDPVAYPRLIDWSEGMLDSPFHDCAEDSQPPFLLFEPRCAHIGRWRCPGYSIAESSPGVGHCHIQITTPEAVTCDPSRGWLDPSASNGSRRPRVTRSGERICDVMPVDPSVMDACIHDETCADCGSGWCVSKVLPLAKYCPNAAPLPIRWIGGALPAPGLVRITCLERVEPPLP